VIIPYRVDVPMVRIPWANYLIVLGCIGVFIWQRTMPLAQEEYLELMVLKGWQPWGFLGHIWLHGGILHLAGNMLFLWVFGNAVCAKLGNIAYLFIYILLGIFAGLGHVWGSGPEIGAIGASGAINGVVGMFVVFFPRNNINCLWLVWLRIGRFFEVSSIYIIAIYVFWDIMGIAWASQGVAYHAHVGGFASGFVLAILLLKFKIIKMTEYERSLLQVLKKEEPKIIPKNPLDFHILKRTDQGEKTGQADIAATESSEGPDYTPALGLRLPLRNLNESHDKNEIPKPPPPPLQLSEPGSDTLGPTSQTFDKEDDVRSRLTEEVDLSVTFLENPAAPNPQNQTPVPEGDNFDPNEILPAPIEFQCDCGRIFKIPRHLGGRSGRCPQCRRRLFIPKR